MNKINKRVILIFGVLFSAPVSMASGVDEQSIFLGARYPVSDFDLQLSNIQRGWWQWFVRTPDPGSKKKYPLIVKAGMGVRLDYTGHDRISATGWVSNLKGFAKLSPEERKQLVYNTLDLLKENLSGAATLVDKDTGRMSGKVLELSHIELSIIINEVWKNDKNENLRLAMPSELGIGQAGYRDGRFVFSETYFLELKVRNGVAVSGTSDKLVTEYE